MFTLCSLTAGVLVRAVVAILVAVAEELLGDAGGVPAGQLVVVTDRLVCHQQRLHLEISDGKVFKHLVIAKIFVKVLSTKREPVGLTNIING